MTDRKIYIDKFADKLKQYDDEIEKLEEKAKNAVSTVKEKIDDGIKDIHLKRKKAGNKFSELKQSSSEAWNELRNGLENVGDDLQSSIEKAKNKF